MPHDLSQNSDHEIPEDLEWLLGAFRLVDLHDSAHAVGVPAQDVVLARPGRELRGLWLDVALELFNYLTVSDFKSPGAFIPIDPFIDQIQQRHPELGVTDVQYVVRVLARPTEVHFLSGREEEINPKSFVTKDTALLERSRSGGLVRLSARGHQTVQIAKSAKEWIYTGDLSDGVVKALRLGDFGKMIALCGQMVRSINREAEQLVAATEQPGFGQLRRYYLENRGAYQETIEGALKTLLEVREHLATTSCAERFQQYTEKYGEGAVLWDQIRRAPRELAQSLEGFLKRFLECIDRMQDRGAVIARHVDFSRLALRFAYDPLSEAEMMGMVDLLMPQLPRTVAPHPVDFRNFIISRTTKTESNRVLLPPADENLSLKELKCIDAYAKRFEQRLAEGPLPLSEIIMNGWVEESSIRLVEELISDFSAPPFFQIGQVRVAVALHDQVKLSLVDGDFRGNDIVLVKCEEVPSDR
ncbi:MAG: hypothetical protein ACFHHU_01165 [Porticoccaceae bacterium]